MKAVKFERSGDIAELAETVRSRMDWDFAQVRTEVFIQNHEYHRGQYQYSGVIEGKDPRSYEERVKIVKKRELGRSIVRALA